MRYSLILNGISVLTFLIAVGFLIVKGLHLSIEFTGGTVMEVSYQQPAELEKIRATVESKGWGETQVQNFGTARDVLIRIPLREGVPSGQQAEQVMTALKSQDASAELRRVEFVGPQVGAELAQDGALALLIVVIGIMIYLAFRFEWKFSVAAIIANLHDVVLVIGMFSIFGWEFSLPVLAAVLAVLGYSVNESVIIFDRVREHFKKYRKMSTVEVIDSAITATISRTIITHGCTLAMTLAMLIFGGPALHYFALALTIGICFGVYSSVFVAAAIAMYLGVKREDLDQADQEGRPGGGDRSLGNAAATGAHRGSCTPRPPPPDPARTAPIRVWDLPTRLFHWLLAVLVVFSFVTAKVGGGWADWHFYSGYAILALLVFRLLWGFAGNRYARFRASCAGRVRSWRTCAAARRSPAIARWGRCRCCCCWRRCSCRASPACSPSDDIASEGPLLKLVSGEAGCTARAAAPLEREGADRARSPCTWLPCCSTNGAGTVT